MKRQIENPYNVNYKLYAVIMAWTALGIVIGNILPTYWMITDIIKNLSYGCFASTVVALLIEVQSIKDKYIGNWADTAMFNEMKFEPYGFWKANGGDTL